jgi:hypothetical protein
MNPQEYQDGFVPKRQQIKNSDTNGYDPAALLFSEIIQTREIRSMIAQAVPEVLNAWAGNNFAKKMTTRVIGKNLKNGLSRPEDSLGNSELAQLFLKPENIQSLADEIPGVLDKFFDLLNKVGEGVECLPLNEKEKVLGRLISAVFNGRTGKTITTWARVISRTQAESPGFLNARMEPGITRWIETTDFGELKDLLETVSAMSGDTLQMLNDAVWKYPGKVVLLVSFFPALANMLAGSVEGCVARFNRLSPDLVADVVLSCLRDIDAAGLARMVNELTELTRKLDTGSSLIGDAGVSAFGRDISAFLNTFVSSLDIKKMYRYREGLASGKESVANAVAKILDDHPEILLETISRLHLLYNPSVKTAGQKTAIVADLPEKEMCDAFSKSVSQLAFNDLAEIINNTAFLVNRIRNDNPKLFPSAVSQIVDSLDRDEVESAVSGLLADVGESIEPIGRVALPHMIKTACDWLSEGDGEPVMEEAKEAIRRLLRPKEAHV